MIAAHISDTGLVPTQVRLFEAFLGSAKTRAASTDTTQSEPLTASMINEALYIEHDQYVTDLQSLLH